MGDNYKPHREIARHDFPENHSAPMLDRKRAQA